MGEFGEGEGRSLYAKRRISPQQQQRSASSSSSRHQERQIDSRRKSHRTWQPAKPRGRRLRPIFSSFSSPSPTRGCGEKCQTQNANFALARSGEGRNLRVLGGGRRAFKIDAGFYLYLCPSPHKHYTAALFPPFPALVHQGVYVVR